jgi:hypothetical protein
VNTDPNEDPDEPVVWGPEMIVTVALWLALIVVSLLESFQR